MATVSPSVDNKVLLILDGHASHTQNIDAIVQARDKGVIMLSLPPHCTHRLQPLDISFFKPLSTFYSQYVDSWMRANPGLSVGEQKVTQFFREAYLRAASISTAVNGFKKSGIWPINPNAISEEEFAPSDVTEKPQPDARSAATNSDVKFPAVAPNAGLPVVEVVVHNEDGTSTCAHIVVESPRGFQQDPSLCMVTDVQSVEQLPQQVGISGLEQALSDSMPPRESMDVQVPVPQSPDMPVVEMVLHDDVGIVQLPSVKIPMQHDQITDIPDVEPSNNEALLSADAATASTTINSPVEQPQYPVDKSPSHHSTGRVTAHMLSPLPVRHPSHTTAKRRVGLGATVLTESPYKRVLEEKLKAKRPSSTKAKDKKEANAIRKPETKDKEKNKAKTVRKPKVKNCRVERRAPLKAPNPVSKRLELGQPRKPVWLDSYKRGYCDYVVRLHSISFLKQPF